MKMNCYRLTIDCYSAFLQTSNLPVNKLSAAYLEFNGGNIEQALKEAEGNGLVKKNRITPDGSMIASIISAPQKAIVASNSSFGAVPLCVFSFKNGFWVLSTIDYSTKVVTLVAPIPVAQIADVARDALIGERNLNNFSPFSMTLTNDEMTIYSLALLLLNNRAKAKNEPLLMEDSYFCFQDLIMGSEFATLALVEDVAGDNSNALAIVNDPERCRIAFNGLLEKQVFAKCKYEGYCIPAISMFYRLAPQRGMVILSYKDLETDIGHKYYLLKDSIMEITAKPDSITFTSVSDIDYSLWA